MFFVSHGLHKIIKKIKIKKMQKLFENWGMAGHPNLAKGVAKPPHELTLHTHTYTDIYIYIYSFGHWGWPNHPRLAIGGDSRQPLAKIG
jgi:hypothetical protein